MPNPFFTVITVTYNSSQFVRDAIESVLASTFTDFELIIGDDCSTDNTWEIINEYIDPRIVKYRNELNLREYPNRNKALKMARGEWVIFIDGDDVIYSHGLSYIKFCIMEYSDLSINMILQRGYYNNIILPAVFSPQVIINNLFFGSNPLLGGSFSSLIIRNDAIKKLDYLSEKYVTGDAEIRYRMATLFPTLIINGFTAWARETPKSASSSIGEFTSISELNAQFRFIFQSFNMEILSNDIELGKLILQLDRLIFIRSVKSFFMLSFFELKNYFSMMCILLTKKISFKCLNQFWVHFLHFLILNKLRIT